MKTFNFRLFSPRGFVQSLELVSLTCNTEKGQITILPGHIALVSALVPGEFILRSAAKTEEVHVAGGFLEINKDGEVTVLGDTVERFEEIDEQRAVEAKQKAEQRLRDTALTKEEYAETLALLERNLSRIKIVRKHANRKSKNITSEGVFKQ